jgi:hypothetical protein
MHGMDQEAAAAASGLSVRTARSDSINTPRSLAIMDMGLPLSQHRRTASDLNSVGYGAFVFGM